VSKFNWIAPQVGLLPLSISMSMILLE